MSSKFALVIGNTEYTDSGLAQLTAPGKDAVDFARVLKDPEIGAFDDVKILLNQLSSTIIEAIDDFFSQKSPEDLLVLYFSGHGVRDDIGALYLAAKNTFRNKLRSTAIKSDYIREVMDQSRSRRQVLILDCCNSGAFEHGTKAATGTSMGTATAFEGGYGRIILTASDSTQFAWEGDKVIGKTDKSLFTHFLVKGLEGEADLDGDGRITVDELYDYTYEKVRSATPKQTPSKFSSKQQGEVVLRQGMKLENSRQVPLPDALLDSIENPFAEVRLGAVQELAKLLKSKNHGLAHSAKAALERVAKSDDSRQVSKAAAQALSSVPEIESAQHENQIPLEFNEQASDTPQGNISSIAQEKRPGQTTNIKRELDMGFILLVTLGWIFGGALAGALIWAWDDTVPTMLMAGGLAGGIGGFGVASILRNKQILTRSGSMIIFIFSWIIAGAVGLTLGDSITETAGAAIGGAIVGTIGLIGISMTKEGVPGQKSIFLIVLAWFIAGGIAWTIARLYLSTPMDGSTSWPLGEAIGWGLGGFVTTWQLVRAGKKTESAL